MRRYSSFLFYCACLFLSANITFANTCPSIQELKAHHVSRTWQIVDADTGKILNPHREARYIASVSQFAMAEWMTKPGKTQGNLHCYYKDNTGSTLETYVLNTMLKPTNLTQWYAVSDAKQCAAGNLDCELSHA